MAKYIKINRKEYSKAFLPVLKSKHRYLVVYGGRGSGKTNHIILKLLALTFLSEHISIVYARHEKTTLRDTTFKDIVNYIENSRYKNYFEYSKAHNSSMIFTNKITGKQMLPFGLSDEENTKGISEATHVWVDEADKCTQEQVTTINAVIRTPKAKQKQLIVSFNPVSDKSWLRDFFFSKSDISKPAERFAGSIMVHHSTVRDNEYIDVDAYVKNLELNANGNQNRINVDILGKWGHLEAKNPFIYAKTDKLFNANLNYDRRYPIWVSLDINNDPLTCLISQCAQGLHSHTYGYIHTFDEIKVTPSLMGEYSHFDKFQILCTIIKQRYPHAGIFLTGDSSGWQGNTLLKGDTGTFYLYMAKLLNLNVNSQVMTPRSNLRHTVSQNLCNSALMNHPDIQINPNTCPMLANEIEIAEIDDKGKLIKDRKEYALDSFDAWRYQLATVLDSWQV